MSVLDTLAIVPIYAAYGSNMDPAQMMQRAPHSPMYGTGWLPGWRLTFAAADLVWEGALTTVVEEPGSRVFVVLYDVTPEDEARLDGWEGSDFGLHRKIRLRVDIRSDRDTPERPQADTDPIRDAAGLTPGGSAAGESVLAWLYVLDAYEGGLPSARLLGVMADAAEKAGAPADYIHGLRTRNSRNVGPGGFGR